MWKDRIIKNIVLFILLFVLSFIYSFFISTVYNDEIWNYGFSYNIYSGLVPYRDFNMIVTPMYAMLGSVFIRLFGEYLLSLHIFNSIVLASIMFISYKRLGKKALILFPFVLLNCYPGYNIFSVLLILLIINLVDREFKYRDFILGIIVGMMFLTKQTVGITLIVPLLYYSKNKLKSLVGFSFVVIIFIVYLISNRAIFEFIDYCFLGMFDFGNSNGVLLFLPIEIVILLFLVFKLYKSYGKDKKALYILMYQVIVFPIMDDYHFMIGFIPVMYYILDSLRIEKYKIKYYVIISLFFCLMWNFYVHEVGEINLYEDESSYLYGRNVPDYVNLSDITNYIKESNSQYDHVYLLSKNAYYVKLEAKYKLDKFDLINDGNMGYNGSYKYIKEIDKYCSNNKCMFIMYAYEYNVHSQSNKDIIYHIINTYNKKEIIGDFNIYSN